MRINVLISSTIIWLLDDLAEVWRYDVCVLDFCTPQSLSPYLLSTATFTWRKWRRCCITHPKRSTHFTYSLSCSRGVCSVAYTEMLRCSVHTVNVLIQGDWKWTECTVLHTVTPLIPHRLSLGIMLIWSFLFFHPFPSYRRLFLFYWLHVGFSTKGKKES